MINHQNNVTRKSLVVKLLKSNINNVRQPVWKLMMKNIYNLGANQLSMDDFRLNIYYNDPSPLNYIKAVDNNTWPSGLDKKRLLNVFELDRLNMNGNLQEDGDGFFDAIEGITIIKNCLTLNKKFNIIPTEEEKLHNISFKSQGKKIL